jgi:hypothetical protein
LVVVFVVVVVVFLAGEVATFAVVFAVAGFGVSAAGAGTAGATGTWGIVVTAGVVLIWTTAIGFVGRPRSLVTGLLEVSTMSTRFAVLLVTTGASLLSAECATPAGSAAEATIIDTAAMRRTSR